MKKILHVVEIPASRNEVYRAITTEEGLSNWWTTDVSADVRPDGVIEFRFGEEFKPTMRITQLDEGRAVGWHCISGNDVWVDSTISFNLSDNEDTTQLMFTHTYATDLPDVAFGTFNFNWAYYLDSLREYCESGTGKPFQTG